MKPYEIDPTKPNPEQLALAQQGTAAWNTWRRDNQGQNIYLWYADLSQASLPYGFLTGARFDNSDLSRSDLNNVFLQDSDLHGANLNQADLHQAILTRADLSGANLCNADLRWSHLYGANLDRADLRGADLSGADLYGAHLLDTDLSGADLRGVSLVASSLVSTNVENTNFAECQIYGISAWDLKGPPKDQTNLVLTRHSDQLITVDNLQVAQFLYLLLYNPEIRTAIDTITSKVVLILGRFTEERKATLDALRQELRKHGLVPVLFDFEKPMNRDLTETVSTIAHLARFVIADITDAKSIPQELQKIVPNLPSLPIQPIILESQYEYAMFKDFGGYFSVLPPYRYKSTGQLIASLEKSVIAPVVKKAQSIAGRRKEFEAQLQ